MSHYHNNNADDGTTSPYAPRSPDLSFLNDNNTTNEPYRLRSPQIPGYSSTSYEPPSYPPIPPLPNTHNQFLDRGGITYQIPSTSQYQPRPPPPPPPPPSPPNKVISPDPQNSLPTTNPNLIENPRILHPTLELFDRLTKSSTSAQIPNIQSGDATYSDRGDMAQATSSSGAGDALGPSQGIEIRTKFPVARIKRIMQADEEVGKVAQVTPVAVSKALELFMISLCTKSAAVARSSSSKRITAAHLKAAIESDEQFDFLNEITSKVAGPPEPSEAAAGEKKGRGRAKAKVEVDSDEEGGEGAVEVKKKGGRGRKKKEA